MNSDNEDLELARWQAMLGSVAPSARVNRDIIEDARLGAMMAFKVQRSFNGVRAAWFTGFDRVKDRVTWSSNEGYYKEIENGAVVKTLDTGHTLSDITESMRIAMGKVLKERDEQSINYHSAWEYMRLLPAKACGQDPERLVGAHGSCLYPGTYMFVICVDGSIRYFPNDDDHCEPGETTKHYLQFLPHAALTKREPVFAAGNFCVDGNHRMLWAASNSGHYRVDDEMCLHNLNAALTSLGYAHRAQVVPKMSWDITPDAFTYLCYKECLGFQKQSKANMPLWAGDGVRRTRTLLVSTIKDALEWLAKGIQDSRGLLG